MTQSKSTSQSGNQFTVRWRASGQSLTSMDAAVTREYEACERDIEAYQTDGVILLRGVFDDWVDRLRAGLERNLKDPGAYAFPCESTKPGEAGRFFDSYCNWERIPEYTDYLRHSVAASMAGQFMRSSFAQFFHEHAFVKEPGTQRATPWHQDLPYYCVDGSQTISIYVSLDSAPKDVTVRFVAGSHRAGSLYFPRHFIDGAHFNHNDPTMQEAPNIDADEPQYDIRAWALEPGDAILFSFRTLHGTTDVVVRERRRAFSTRWFGDDVRFCERHGETSPPYPNINLKDGDRMREDWFPVLWRKSARTASAHGA